MPTVSVIIPTYNRSWGLIRAVNKVLCQTFQDFEIIIVDDFSQDDTPQVVETLQDPRIRYFRQPQNVGVAQNWGTGLEMAQGEFVCFLMDDDFYEPQFLENRISALQANPNLCVVFSSYILCDAEGKTLWEKVPPFKDHVSLNSEDLLKSILHQHWFIGTSMYRRDAVQAVWHLTKDDRLIVDYSLAIHLALQEKGQGLYIDSRDFFMAYHPGQNSQAKLGEVLVQIDQVLSKFLAEPLPPRYARPIRSQLSKWKVMQARHLTPNLMNRLPAFKLLFNALYIDIQNAWAWRQICKLALLGKL
jgi:glycosyltransferase involved in cell wall biosynthesis